LYYHYYYYYNYIHLSFRAFTSWMMFYVRWYVLETHRMAPTMWPDSNTTGHFHVFNDWSVNPRNIYPSCWLNHYDKHQGMPLESQDKSGFIHKCHAIKSYWNSMIIPWIPHENHTKIPSNPMSRNHETHPEKSSENPRRPACHTMDNDLQLMRTGMDLWRLILYVGIIVGIFNDQIFRIQDIYRFLDVCLLIYMDYIIDLFIMMHTLV
jgi:hypothetical protein